MSHNIAIAFRAYLKGNTGMKLLSDAATHRVTYEGITNFEPLADFDRKNIESLPCACKEMIISITADITNGIAVEPELPDSNLSSISIRCLIVSIQATKYYTIIGRIVNVANMHWSNNISIFNTDFESYKELK